MAAAPSGSLVKMSLAALFWGGTFNAGRLAAAEMSAPTAALWRYVVASIALGAMAFLREGGLPRLNAGQWLTMAVLGLTGVAAYNLCFMYGLQSVSAARGSLIIALNPAATMIGAALFMHERITLAKIAGIAVALTGVAIELSNGNPLALVGGGIGRGEVALFACTVSWAVYTLVGKRIVQEIPPLAVTAYSAMVGTAMLAAVALARGDLVVPHASAAAWLSLAYMGVFGTAIAFAWFLEGVQAFGPARAAIFLNLVPVAAIAIGALLLGEAVTAPMLAGAALVIAGVFIINRPAPAAPAAATQPD